MRLGTLFGIRWLAVATVVLRSYNCLPDPANVKALVLTPEGRLQLAPQLSKGTHVGEGGHSWYELTEFVRVRKCEC